MKTFITLIYIVICVVLAAVVLMQESHQRGLGALTGGTTFWAQAKGRSKEGRLKKLTYILSVLFFALSLVLSIL